MIHVLYFNGISRGNPGEASFGAALYDAKGKEVNTVKGTLGKTTNNVAEYCGMLFGMNMAIQWGCKTLVVRGDSQIVLQQVQGRWTTREPKLKLLFNKIRRVIPQFENVIFEHVRKEINVRAYKLADEALLLSDQEETIQQ